MWTTCLVVFLLSPLAQAEPYDAQQFVREMYGERDGAKTASCKASNLDGSDLVDEVSATDKSLMRATRACIDMLEERIKKKMKCAPTKEGHRFRYKVHTKDGGEWDKKGWERSVQCKRPGEKLSKKCKAANLDGTDLVGETVVFEETRGKLAAACSRLVEEKVRKIKCSAKNSGLVFQYAYRSEADPGLWTDGLERSVKCP